MMRAVVNMLGNGIATLVVARWEKEVTGEMLQRNLEKTSELAMVAEV
jgi:aerobic C4-dicarboxylate transport protein